MEGWIIILGIALLRGLGAWMRRRQKQQQNESPGNGQRRPEPGDPDAFDVEDFDPVEEPWVPPWDRQEAPRPQSQPQAPPRPEPSTRPMPESPYGAPSWQPGAAGDPPVLSDEERKRQEMLQRLAQAAADVSQTARSLETPVEPSRRRPHPMAGRGARISHQADRAYSLHAWLRSRHRVRQAMLLREVLGPPVALRGPLRTDGSQPR